MSNDIASSVLVDGFIYGFDLREMQAAGRRPSRGTFRCVDFTTGQVRWSSDKPGQASIVVADGKLLMLNDTGQAMLVRPTLTTMKNSVAWTFFQAKLAGLRGACSKVACTSAAPPGRPASL